MNVVNTIITQTDAKSNMRIITLIFSIALTLYIPISYANAVPQDPNFSGGKCEDNPAALVVTCCWYESDEEGIEIRYCQHCDIDIKTGDVTNNCGEKHLVGYMPPPYKGNVVPEGDIVIDDAKQPNPQSPVTDQRVPLGNVGTLEQLEDSSNNQNGESENSLSSNPNLIDAVPQNPTVLEQQTSDDSNNENLPLDDGSQR